MTLTDLVGQWRSEATNTGDPAFANGILNCAEELDDFIRVHFGEKVE